MASPRSKTVSVEGDLQALGLEAEQAVIRRDARVRQRAEALGAHAQRLASPAQWLTTVAGGLGALLLGKLFRGQEARSRRDREPEREASGGVTWLVALRLALPLLSQWLARTSTRGQRRDRSNGG